MKFGNTSILGGGVFFCFTLSLCVMGFVCERKLDIERLYMQEESLMLKSFVHERKHLHPYFQIHVLTFWHIRFLNFKKLIEYATKEMWDQKVQTYIPTMFVNS